MKKLITIILIVAMILPAAVIAEEGMTSPVGCWAGYELQTTGTPAMYMIYLAEDHICYYLIQSYNKDEPDLGRQFVGTWEQKADGSVSAKTGNNTTTTLRFADNYTVAMNMKTGAILVNLSYFYSLY
jgi:hypothetical protein